MSADLKFKIVDKILTIYPPIILSIGLIGNVLSVIVLSQASNRRTSTGVMLIFLTVTDSLILINSVLESWLNHMFELDFRMSSNGACKFHVFLSYFLFQLSPWILVFITSERVFSVKYPHKVRDVFTRKRVFLGMFILILILVGVNAHLIHGYNHSFDNVHKRNGCFSSSDHEDFMFSYWTWIDFVLAFAIPFCVLLCGNILVIHKLKSSQNFRKTSTIITRNGQEINGNSFRRGNQTVSDFTTTAIVLNIAFFCLVSPFSIFAIGQPYWFPKDTITLERFANMKLIGIIFLMLLHTNSAINFILYILCGSKFRKDFMALIFKRRRTMSDTMLSTRSIRTQSLSMVSS